MEIPKIRFISGSEDIIDEIAPLWTGLNEYMMMKSRDFKAHFLEMNFERRKADLLRKSKDGKMRVDIAVEGDSERRIGYCVSSVNNDKVGEVESIFVDPDFRDHGIGGSLMKRAISWLDDEGASSMVVEVTVGNEGVLEFYARYGLLPRKIVLLQTKAVK